MPDEYGRPQFSDWTNIAAGLKSLNEDRSKKNISAVAQKIAENPDWKPGEGETYTPDEMWQGRVLGTSAATDKLRLSEATMREKTARYQLEHEEFTNEWGKKVAPLLVSNPDEGIAAAYNLFNGTLKNGITVKALEGNKIEITGPNGTSVQQAPSVDQVNQMGQAMMDPKAFISSQIAWDNDIRKMNVEQAMKAQDLRDPKTGKSLGVKMANFYDKATNSNRPVFISSTTGKELSAEEIKALADKGYITSEDMKTTLDLQKKALEAQNEQLERVSKLLGIAGKKQDLVKGAQEITLGGLKIAGQVEENKGKKLDNEKKSKDLAVGEDKTKVSDISSIERMIYDAGDNPTGTQIELIKKAANKIGMEFVNKEIEPAKERSFWFDKAAKTGWVLQPKAAGLASASGTPRTAPKAEPKPQANGKKKRMVYDPATGIFADK